MHCTDGGGGVPGLGYWFNRAVGNGAKQAQEAEPRVVQCCFRNPKMAERARGWVDGMETGKCKGMKIKRAVSGIRKRICSVK
jgi:hypothetical protein